MSNITLANQTNTIPLGAEFQTMKELAKMAVASGLIPSSINTPEKALIIMLKARELGIPPMQGFSSIGVINGKPAMSAELMLALLYRNIPGFICNFVETTDKKCVIEAKRPNGKTTKFSFTMADAEAAGLAGKGPWKTYPSAMLRARCTSAMARAMGPDALSGVVYTPEELGAVVDEEGNIETLPEVSTQPENVEPKPETNFVRPAPKPESIIPQAFLEAEEDAPEPIQLDSGDYRVEVGKKYKGMRLRDIPAKDLISYSDWLKTEAEKRGLSHPNDSALAFINAVDRYLQTAGV
jgi:hypothetical protein